MIHVAAIHGVNHDDEQQKTFSAAWQKLLKESIPDLNVFGCPWSSQGSAVKDWFATWRDQKTWFNHLGEVSDALFRWEKSTKGQPRVLLAHSWGTLLAYNLKLTMPELDDVHMIGLGTPFTHAYLGRRLAWAERALPWAKYHRGKRPHFVCNKDDGISSFRPLGFDRTYPAPKGTVTHWIDVPDASSGTTDAGWVGEHAIHLYLRHRTVVNLIVQKATAGL